MSVFLAAFLSLSLCCLHYVDSKFKKNINTQWQMKQYVTDEKCNLKADDR